MRERIMFVSDVPEEVDPIPASEYRCLNRVDGHVTTALFIHEISVGSGLFIFTVKGIPGSRSRRYDRGS